MAAAVSAALGAYRRWLDALSRRYTAWLEAHARPQGRLLVEDRDEVVDRLQRHPDRRERHPHRAAAGLGAALGRLNVVPDRPRSDGPSALDSLQVFARSSVELAPGLTHTEVYTGHGLLSVFRTLHDAAPAAASQRTVPSGRPRAATTHAIATGRPSASDDTLTASDAPAAAPVRIAGSHDGLRVSQNAAAKVAITHAAWCASTVA